MKLVDSEKACSLSLLQEVYEIALVMPAKEGDLSSYKLFTPLGEFSAYFVSSRQNF